MKVAVIQGGPSTEAFVSRKSAAAVQKALESSGHEAACLELDADLPARLIELGPDVVFPAVHGAQGEDGCLQGLLEILGLPYVGSDVRASAIAADKIASKVFFAASGLLMANDLVLERDALSQPSADLLETLRAEIGSEFVLKPSEGGSTIGVSRVLAQATADEFAQALIDAFKHDDSVLAERYVRGREVTCAVFEDEAGPRALAVTLITAEATDWYDFQSKYAAGGSRHECPANLPPVLTERIQQAAVAAHRAVGARDLSRSDFMIDETDEPFLLEINTLPGMTDVSLYPEAAQAAGISFVELVDGLVRRAQARAGLGRPPGRPLPP